MIAATTLVGQHPASAETPASRVVPTQMMRAAIQASAWSHALYWLGTIAAAEKMTATVSLILAVTLTTLLAIIASWVLAVASQALSARDLVVRKVLAALHHLYAAVAAMTVLTEIAVLIVPTVDFVAVQVGTMTVQPVPLLVVVVLIEVLVLVTVVENVVVVVVVVLIVTVFVKVVLIGMMNGTVLGVVKVTVVDLVGKVMGVLVMLLVVGDVALTALEVTVAAVEEEVEVVVVVVLGVEVEVVVEEEVVGVLVMLLNLGTFHFRPQLTVHQTAAAAPQLSFAVVTGF